MFVNGAKNIINRFYKATDKWNANKHKLTKDNSFAIVPFNVIAGYITSTENGLRTNNSVQVADYSTFQRVFTGLQNLLAVWEGVWEVKKETETDLFLTKKPQTGRFFRGFIPNETQGVSFQPSKIDASFIAQFSDESFTVHVYEDISEADLFKLYIIPGVQEKWLYIANAEKFYTPHKELHHTEITFQTLNFQIAQSGGAVEQFMQRSAPGEGYAWPIIDELGIPQIDTIKVRDVPITSMQVEYQGPAAFNTIFAYGRPVEMSNVNGVISGKFNDKIQAPRLLLPFQLETPIPSPLNTKPSAEGNFYSGVFRSGFWENYEQWQQQFKQYYDVYQRSNYEGMLITDKLSDIQASNPLNNGQYDHILWDKAWKPNIDATFDTSPNAMTGQNLPLKGAFSMTTMLSHMIFGSSYIDTIPMSKEQNVVWNLKDIPVIGGFLNLLSLGVPVGWNNLAIKLAATALWFMLPISIVEYGNVLVNEKTACRVPLETFTGKRSDDITTYSGINSTGTIIKVSLTHRFKKTIGGKVYVFDTKDLGQVHPTMDDNKVAIPGTLPAKLLWDETCEPTDRGTVPGYVIDTATHKTLAKLTYRLTFFSNDYEAWTGTYNSRSLFTQNIRDWNNTMKFSFWNEVDNKSVSYPAVIVAPNPPNVNNPVIDMQISKQNSLKTILYNGRPAYQVYNTRKIDGVLKIAEFDTTPLGGITAVNNNYATMDFVINSGLITGTQPSTYPSSLKVNLSTLITSGTVNIDTYPVESVIYQYYSSLVYPDNPNSLETKTFTTPASTLFTFQAKTNGNVIEFYLLHETNITGNWFSEWDVNDGIDWDKTYFGIVNSSSIFTSQNGKDIAEHIIGYEVDITSAKIVPKQIITK